jgi:trimethylamine--corrinoid protein Co-methyltransferase
MSPQAMQIIAGSIQMGRYYNLVTQALSATESRRCDAQAAGERFFSFTIALLAGASIIQGATSEMAGMELADYAQCVIDNEIAGYAFEFASGLAMEEMDEAVNAVYEVAGDPKQYETLFLEHPYTVKKCHAFSFRPDLFSTGMLSRWIAENQPELTQKAHVRVRELLRETPQFVSPDLRKEFSRIVSD